MRQWVLPFIVVCIFGVSLLLLGRFGKDQTPDPNEPTAAGQMLPQVLSKNLKAASDVVNDRTRRGEITGEQGQKMLMDYADKLITSINLNQISEADAYLYADIFRTAKRWDLARAAYMIAIKNSLNEDRRVNDHLRLALCEAMVGNYEQCIPTARRVFDASLRDSAPILPAVLLEITPALRGHGFDVGLAKLLMDAAEIHSRTVVNRRRPEGITFIYARPHHLREAYRIAGELFKAAGLTKEAQDAEVKRLSVTTIR